MKLYSPFYVFNSNELQKTLFLDFFISRKSQPILEEVKFKSSRHLWQGYTSKYKPVSGLKISSRHMRCIFGRNDVRLSTPTHHLSLGLGIECIKNFLKHSELLLVLV